MASIFLSYASSDKHWAKRIAADLAGLNHQVWLDEWALHVGESIPLGIQKGIEQSDFLVVLLSRRAVESEWVSREWQAAYWNEVDEGRIAVLPVRLEKCSIPGLLRAKRYADLSGPYENGFKALIDAIEYFVRLRKDRDFDHAVAHVWSEERVLRGPLRARRAASWDHFEQVVSSLPASEKFEVQQLNSISYLDELGLTAAALKEALGRLGFRPGVAGNNFDAALADAIVRFQVLHNLRHHDGIFGPLTYLKMAEVAHAGEVRRKS